MSRNSPKLCRSTSMIEPPAEHELSGFGPAPGVGGGAAPGGGPPGQLQSHGLKCVTHARHKVWPGAYNVPTRRNSSSVKASAANCEAFAGAPLPVTSTSATPLFTDSTLITRPFGAETHFPF